MTHRHRTSWRWALNVLLVAAGLGAFLPYRAAAVTTADATISVTPTATVSITLSGTTTYALGAIPVNTSTETATALTLTNNGEVSVQVDKRIAIESNPVGWTAGAAAGLDTYALYCATSTVQPQLSDFLTSGVSKFGAQGAVTNLAGPTGTHPILPPTGAGSSVNLWFRLDMPTKVSSTTPRSMTVRFTGTAQ